MIRSLIILTFVAVLTALDPGPKRGKTIAADYRWLD